VIRTLAIGGYRSLRDLRLELGSLTAITGGNGAGKSNVYRALRLLVDAADGGLGRALAREGGMPSARWAGAGKARGTGSAVRLSIGFADDVIAYELRLGLPQPRATAFKFDPEVKEETIRLIARPHARLLERRNASVMLRDDDGRPVRSPRRIVTRCCR
jgi:predicted ATPase